MLQISTHSKMLISKNNLLEFAKRVNIKNTDKSLATCLLQSFETQQQFMLKVKSFFNESNETNEPRLLVIQCDFGKKYDGDLLSCARHTIVEQLKEFAASRPIGNHFVLLLIALAKENSKKFIGFQVGHWSCYHVDDLDESVSYLPSLESMRNKSLSELLTEGLDASVAESLDANDSSFTNTLNLKYFLRRISHQACSLIVDTNLTRTIERIDILVKLWEDSKFLRMLVVRMIELQKGREAYIFHEMVRNWLGKEVADLRSTNEFSTLKRSCENYIESKLSSLLAFILAKIDFFSNLDIYLENCDWKRDLFLSILEKNEFLTIGIDEMRDPLKNNEELKSFVCNSERFKKDLKSTTFSSELRPELPFFWILINQLNDFCRNYRESNKNLDPLKFLSTIPELFESTHIYKIFNSCTRKHEIDEQEILESYINDFILVNCPAVRLPIEMRIIKMVIKNAISEKRGQKNNMSSLKFCLPLVHFLFERLNKKIDLYLQFSAINPRINDEIEKNANSSLSIDFDACLTSIRLFEYPKLEVDYVEMKTSLDKLIKVVQMAIPHFMNDKTYATNASIREKLNKILSQYNSIRFFSLFLKNVIMQNVYDYEPLKPSFDLLCNLLKIELAKRALDFKSNSFIDFVHGFLVKCVAQARRCVYEHMKKSKCCNKDCVKYRKMLPYVCECVVCVDCEELMRNRMSLNKTICLVCKHQVDCQGGQLSVALEDIP